jgi:hypothetical protein
MMLKSIQQGQTHGDGEYQQALGNEALKANLNNAEAYFSRLRQRSCSQGQR